MIWRCCTQNVLNQKSLKIWHYQESEEPTAMHQKVQGWENILLQSLLSAAKARLKFANRCILDKLSLHITPYNSIFTKKEEVRTTSHQYSSKTYETAFSRSKDEKEVAFQDLHKRRLKMEQIWRLQKLVYDGCFHIKPVFHIGARNFIMMMC